MQTRIALGAVLFMLVIAVVGYVIINEGLLPGQTGRMQKFDAQVQGQSIEAGALLFQNNCVGCHGRTLPSRIHRAARCLCSARLSRWRDAARL